MHMAQSESKQDGHESVAHVHPDPERIDTIQERKM